MERLLKLNTPLLFLLLFILSGCTLVTVVQPTAVGPLKVNVCQDALEIPTAYRAFQGLDGWFFFDLDLETSYPLMKQGAFMAEFSRTLATQGVSLVLVPIPSRAVVRPDVVYTEEPLEATFSAAEAKLAYNTFLESLRSRGVRVVDVLGAAQRYDARGGQTFLKRDLHWTTEGSEVMAEEIANVVRQAVAEPLQPSKITLTQITPDEPHRGQFVNRWLYTHCAFVIEGEPLQKYEVMQETQGGSLFGSSSPEVVLAGSSFSGEPYYYDFLAGALQSEVLNVSVGAGGAQVGVETYLLDGAYEDEKPKVLVWEFPIYAPPLSEATQRQLIGSVYGSCSAPASRVDLTSASSTVLPQKHILAAQNYLQLAFSDLSLLRFTITLHYRDGFSETLTINRSALTLNRGNYFLMLTHRPEAVLQRVDLRVPHRSHGTVNVKTCPISGELELSQNARTNRTSKAAAP